MAALALQNPPEKHWERAIVSIKMPTFFSSIEQLDNPALKNRAIGITNHLKGKLLFCCSGEAEKKGIRKGMKVNDAKRLAPSFLLTPARYERYTEVSENIVAVLAAITANVEVNSINQLYLDITNIQQELGPPEMIVEFIAQKIQRLYPGLPVSIGLAGDKTTAAYAAGNQDKSGIMVIPPCLSEQRLSNIPLSRLDGVSRSTALFLARRGIHRCGDMKNVDVATLIRHFGKEGKRLWYMAQGLDPSPIRKQPTSSKTIADTKVLLQKDATNFNAVKNTINVISQSLSQRLQTDQLQSRRIHIAISLTNGGWIGKSFKLRDPVYTSKQLAQLGIKLLMSKWRNEAISKIKMCALDLEHLDLQKDLFHHAQQSSRANATDIVKI